MPEAEYAEEGGKREEEFFSFSSFSLTLSTGRVEASDKCCGCASVCEYEDCLFICKREAREVGVAGNFGFRFG